jgi:hypothetical protein
MASNKALNKDVEDYIYQSDFGSQSQANSGGLSLTIPIYDVPVQLGGNYSDTQRNKWRKEYQSKHTDILSYEAAFSSALKQVDSNVVNAWLSCVTHLSNDQGLTAGIKASGKDYVYFWVRYEPKVSGDSAQVSLIQLTGVEDMSHPISVGQAIPLEAGGLGGLYRVTDPSNVTILLQAKTGTNGLQRGTVAPHLIFPSAASGDAVGTFASGAPIVGEIRAIAFGGDKSSAPIENLRRQGWLECAGQALNVLEYPELYVAIRESWGTPAKGVAFNAPNLGGQFLRGWNHGTTIATPNDEVNQHPSAPGDPNVSKRIASQPNGAKGDEVGSFQDAHLEDFPHTVSGEPLKAIDPVMGLDKNRGAYQTASNPKEFGFDTVDTNANANGHDLAPKNVYVMYVIYVGRPILDATP